VGVALHAEDCDLAEDVVAEAVEQETIFLGDHGRELRGRLRADGADEEVVVGWYAEVTWSRPDRWHSPAPDRYSTLVRSVCSMRWPKPAFAENRRTFEAGSSAASSCKGPTRCTTVVLHGGTDSK